MCSLTLNFHLEKRSHWGKFFVIIVRKNFCLKGNHHEISLKRFLGSYDICSKYLKCIQERDQLVDSFKSLLMEKQELSCHRSISQDLTWYLSQLKGR